MEYTVKLVNVILYMCVTTVRMSLHSYHKYCVVGAGPAGLQLGYFLDRANRDYIVFERSNASGHFFTVYPRHRKLISINKRHSGQVNQQFSFRHDWNSLISDDETLLLKYYSKELFPSAEVLVQYLQDYQMKLGIKVQFNTQVTDIQKTEVNNSIIYTMNDQSGNTYLCRTLILATGMWKPNIPDIQGIEKTFGYESFPTNPYLYENKSVLILGIGNSAMETAESIYGHTQYVHVVSRHQDISLAWSTHYVGDLRAVNNNLLDTFLLKSLDGVTYLDMKDASIQERNGKYYVILDEHYLSSQDKDVNIPDNFNLRRGYDVVIRCLGFTFDQSIFIERNISRPTGKARKYPAINHNFESVDFPGLFIAGTAAHSLDFKKSAGGFIHGFRYTSQALHHLLEWRFEGEKWPFLNVPINQMIHLILKRLNEGSGIYQMYGILGDVIIINRDNDRATYLREVPMKLLYQKFSEYFGHNASEVIVLYLDYGWLSNDISKFESVASEAHLSYFLHPVLYYYRQLPTEKDWKQIDVNERLPRPDSVHHVVEDFLVLWQSLNEHIRPLRRWLEHILHKNLRQFYSEKCFHMAMNHRNFPESCQDNYIQGRGLFQISHFGNMSAVRRVIMSTLY